MEDARANAPRAGRGSSLTFGMNILRTLSGVLVALLVTAQGLSARPSTEKYFSDARVIRLAEAAGDGNISEITKLIAAGVDVNAVGRGTFTPLLYALLCQNKDGFACLLSHGANPNTELSDTLDDLLTKGNSVMSLSAKLEESWYLKQVLQHGGDPNLVNATRSQTPILAAMFSSRTQNVKLLIASGANLNWQDRHGATPLILAAETNEYELAFAMAQAGADPNIKNKWGKSVVYFIKSSRALNNALPDRAQWREKLAELLQKKGVDVTNGE